MREWVELGDDMCMFPATFPTVLDEEETHGRGAAGNCMMDEVQQVQSTGRVRERIYSRAIDMGMLLMSFPRMTIMMMLSKS
jgi:hypothetical protein